MSAQPTLDPPGPGQRAGAETELKFQLDPARRAAVERALATRTAKRVALRAHYFDTGDGRLAGAQLALRLRHEGDRWVQTLKGRGDGLMQRLEDEVPLTADADPTTVPALDPARHDGTHAGRALRAALAGGPPPVPVYGTDIQRLKRVLRVPGHPGARVEVALDTGALLAGAARAEVCEVEFELLDGPIDALFALAASWSGRFGLVLDVTTKAERGQRLARGEGLAPLVRAEAVAMRPGGTLGQARAQAVAAALGQALPNASALVGGAGGPDHVHQLRVGLRRLRTVLRAFGPHEATRDRVLRSLFAALGAGRDADVLTATLAPAWQAADDAGLARPAQPVRTPDTDAVAALRAPSTTALWLQLLALAVPSDQGVDERPWADLARATARRWRRAQRRGVRDWSELDDTHRHRLRKRLKRLRYLLDVAADLWPAKAMASELDALRRLQDALGHWNDLVVAREAVGARLAQAGGAPAPALSFVAGWLAAQGVQADRACLKAVRRWRRLPPLPARAKAKVGKATRGR